MERGTYIMNVHEIEEYLLILKYTLVQPHFNILHLPHFFRDLSNDTTFSQIKSCVPVPLSFRKKNLPTV